MGICKDKNEKCNNLFLGPSLGHHSSSSVPPGIGTGNAQHTFPSSGHHSATSGHHTTPSGGPQQLAGSMHIESETNKKVSRSLRLYSIL